jgi:tetratricopeptide (TPR) repeat protein
VLACALALSSGGGDLAVLRRLHRLQLRRGDLQAALAALVQIAAALPEGPGRAEACARAAELCEWRLGEQRRALALYQEALAADPGARLALAGVARLAAREGRAAEAAAALEKLAEASSGRERAAALRQAIALRAHRTGEPEKAAALSRRLLADDANDLPAAASLLHALAGEPNAAAARERAGLRARLAAECRDPLMAAVLCAGAAEDWLASGDRDRGIADYRRALVHNPHDRRVLDAVEEALRGGEVRRLLAEHLAFRCEHEEPRIKAACSLQRAELLAEDGDLAGAAAAFRAALDADPDSLLAASGARLVAACASDQAEAMRLLTGEAALAQDPGLGVGPLVEAALLAEKLAHPAADAPTAVEQPKLGSATLEQRATAAVAAGRWAEAAAAYRDLIRREVPRTDWVRALSRASARAGDSETAFCARAALIGLGAADAAEKAAHDQVMTGPPLAELPPLADAPALLGEGDGGPAREL